MRAILDDPPNLHSRPVCSRKRGCEGPRTLWVQRFSARLWWHSSATSATNSSHVLSQVGSYELNTTKFLAGASPDSKAYHFQHERVAVQESSPQNNFRRVIAALIPAGEFCNHKINYVPDHKTNLPLKFIAALLNSALIDWYSRLGSTNAAVSHYQLYNMPCPSFAAFSDQRTTASMVEVMASMEKGDLGAVENHLGRLTTQAPFEPAIASIIASIVDRIIEAEHQRGPISRAAQSELAPQPQAWQDVIDRTSLMAGISAAEHEAFTARLSKML